MGPGQLQVGCWRGRDEFRMNLATRSVAVDCPYCGERFEVVVDPSVEDQEYIEDCWVCCQPIVMSVSVVDDDVHVSARQENE